MFLLLCCLIFVHAKSFEGQMKISNQTCQKVGFHPNILMHYPTSVLRWKWEGVGTATGTAASGYHDTLRTTVYLYEVMNI